MNNPFNLAGRTVLITGASSGIGRQCAISCSEQGAGLILLGRREDALQETAAQCGAGPVFTASVDMQNYAELAGVVKEGVDALGRVSGVIHCAGISTTLPLRAFRPARLEEMLRVNVVGALELTRLLCKPAHFSKEGGSIIFLSSVMGVVGEKGKFMYSASKGALVATVKSLALELAPRQVRVNCISPGVVSTPMSQEAVYSQSDDQLAAIVARHPLGLGTVSDIAHSCIFLLSDAARWVTGTNLCVDGGYTAQ